MGVQTIHRGIAAASQYYDVVDRHGFIVKNYNGDAFADFVGSDYRGGMDISYGNGTEELTTFSTDASQKSLWEGERRILAALQRFDEVLDGEILRSIENAVKGKSVEGPLADVGAVVLSAVDAEGASLSGVAAGAMTPSPLLANTIKPHDRLEVLFRFGGNWYAAETVLANGAGLLSLSHDRDMQKYVSDKELAKRLRTIVEAAAAKLRSASPTPP